jgi:predicted enzyme related to lactoylglutathione lyase
MNQRVTGIGGIFFKANDPEVLRQWYRKHLGIDSDQYGAIFRWRRDDQPTEFGHTIWSPFPADTKYFDPSAAPFMINYRVPDLDGLLQILRDEGVAVSQVETYDYGRFAWISDPEGNRIELWEPNDKAGFNS